MPLEIRELHIKINMDESSDPEDDLGLEYDDDDDVAASEDWDKEGIIAECVEQILKILNKQKER